jgi:hypothetical protein
MTSHLNSTGAQAVGDDIAGTSDAIVMASAPDIALPLETEPSGDVSLTTHPALRPRWQFRPPWPAIAASAAVGLLLGVILKKSI